MSESEQKIINSCIFTYKDGFFIIPHIEEVKLDDQIVSIRFTSGFIKQLRHTKMIFAQRFLIRLRNAIEKYYINLQKVPIPNVIPNQSIPIAIPNVELNPPPYTSLIAKPASAPSDIYSEQSLEIEEGSIHL